MTIEAVDFFYLSMPVVTDAGDGSQDALVVRVAADGMIGWGECEASPLVSIAAYVTPMSHGACKPVRDVVLGQRIDDAPDIARIAAAVELEMHGPAAGRPYLLGHRDGVMGSARAKARSTRPCSSRLQTRSIRNGPAHPSFWATRRNRRWLAAARHAT
jgi:hypothetical protein